MRTSGTAFAWASYVIPSGYTGAYLGSMTDTTQLLADLNDFSARNRLWDGGGWQVVNLVGNLVLAGVYLGCAWGVLRYRLTRPARV